MPRERTHLVTFAVTSIAAIALRIHWAAIQFDQWGFQRADRLLQIFARSTFLAALVAACVPSDDARGATVQFRHGVLHCADKLLCLLLFVGRSGEDRAVRTRFAEELVVQRPSRMESVLVLNGTLQSRDVRRGERQQ